MSLQRSQQNGKKGVPCSFTGFLQVGHRREFVEAGNIRVTFYWIG